MSSFQLKSPSMKDVVLALMTIVGKEKRDVRDKAIGAVVQKEYLQYRCPKPNCTVSVICFLDKTGFSNPYAHLKRCYAKGLDSYAQEKTLRQLYLDACKETKHSGGTILSNFATRTLSKYENAVHSYIRLIVLKNFPLHFVHDAEVRKFFPI